MYSDTMENGWSQNPLHRHTARTFGWMFLGLLLTFLTAYGFIETGLVYYTLLYSWVPIAILVVKLLLILSFSRSFMGMQAGTVKALFLIYSVTTGITFSSLTFLGDLNDFYFVFAVTAIFFGLMAGAGLMTKKDLSSFGPILTTGLISMVVLLILGLFLDLRPLDVSINFFGLALFLCITLYDTKKMKDLYYYNEGNEEVLEKLAIYSAFELYLDFVNIFLYVLRLNRRRN